MLQAQAEIVKTLQEMSEMNRTLLRKQQDPPPAAPRPSEAEWGERDRVNSIAGLEVKHNLPVIKDTDMDLERHIREYGAKFGLTTS